MALKRMPTRPAPPSDWEMRNLGTLRLYLDDLQDVLDHLQRQHGAPSLLAGDSEADAAIDLKDATPKELRSVRIVAFQGDLKLSLTRQHSRSQWRRSNVKAQTAAEECASLLAPRRLNGGLAFLQTWAMTGWLFTVVALIALVFIVGVRLATDRDVEWSVVWVLPLTAIGVGLFLALLSLIEPSSRNSRTWLYPYLRRESRELSLTRRSAWLVAIVGSITSALLGAGLTMVVTSLTS
ncbi:hypothetical protein [Demequina sp.]|uniref:hypothetical protein n=1 Tax=Demequina sp. TaxID=2050685 RepID=UPI003D0F97A2